ncbi:Stk1 family PASTA domain-containing Ser/Thr kinase [Paenibacillus sp. HB172176]|uniref:Stk1 family PASTA domain-containing Ser/Thr kinase n=1 Tax=Paenibacillus sp. HB172176 TaxID=2493690 RepID=UPI0014392E36|nr:Stk1 family PASTA domain-containing Ser/Thr kinase [Paenibacillus sp. HB172176]
MIGHDLGGRYEIVTRIGGGGMALVYKAHDVLLNRNVAVKVLRQQFVNDEEFIRRFRREAQSAAALSHPNVVSIYDVGQEDDIHYIVMEYVEGNNLNEIIQERAPLQTEEAVRIAMQICDALEHAHQNHIIHRDIKPHNILIGNNGRVKVTDFGIARAATSSTITQTGSVVGSVHYFSPEHAKGINTGTKSDIYSLGIVLYQMLTGKLPFLGESPISVALKHLQEPFEDPRVGNPHIPQSVENVILKAMRKNPDERYDSAHEMLIDLDTCLRPERLSESKITFAHFNDMDETRIMPAIRRDASEASGDRTGRREAVVSSDTDVQWREESAEKRSRGWTKPLSIVGITLLLLAGVIAGFIWILGQLDTEEVPVPSVVGMSEQDARVKLAEVGLKVEEPITREYQADTPEGIVFEQTKMNMSVKKGSSIKLSVSDGPVKKELDNYVGQKLSSAKEDLTALGFDEDRIKTKYEHSDEPAEQILEQTPQQGELLDPLQDEVSFVVSSGPETVEMPDLVDKELSDVKKLLKSLDLVLNEEDMVEQPSYVVEKNHVISMDNYNAGDQVPKGSGVSVTVSTGQPQDAKNYTFNVRISPANAGKTSEVKILISDARGESLDGGTMTISDTADIPVTVVLAPDTVAIVTVYRDKDFMDSKKITYEEAASGSDSNLTIPGNEGEPTEQPTESEQPTGGDEPVGAEGIDGNDQNQSEVQTTGTP